MRSSHPFTHQIAGQDFQMLTDRMGEQRAGTRLGIQQAVSRHQPECPPCYVS